MRLPNGDGQLKTPVCEFTKKCFLSTIRQAKVSESGEREVGHKINRQNELSIQRLSQQRVAKSTPPVLLIRRSRVRAPTSSLTSPCSARACVVSCCVYLYHLLACARSVSPFRRFGVQPVGDRLLALLAAHSRTPEPHTSRPPPLPAQLQPDSTPRRPFAVPYPGPLTSTSPVALHPPSVPK